MQNKTRFTIWVCEYISAGGLANEQLPESLLQEGQLMRDALLNDLTRAGVHCITSHDERVAPPTHGQIQSVAIKPGDDAWHIWQSQLQNPTIDAVWIIAPETDGILARCHALAHQAGIPWIGCSAAAIALCSSKSQLADYCTSVGILNIPHVFVSDWLENHATLPYMAGQQGWVIKPDDGAGCIDTFYCEAHDVAQQVLSIQLHTPLTNFLIQPYIVGQALSFCVIATTHGVQVVTVNTQSISIQHGQFTFRGAGVHHAKQYYAQMQTLAEQLQTVIPGLIGYWGADVILTPQGALYVVEINPRLTTPYIALSQVLATNPATTILNAVIADEPTQEVAYRGADLDLNTTLPASMMAVQ